MTIGTAIRTHRRAAGLTQTDLANRLGVTLGTVCNWERDVTDVPAIRLVTIARIVRCGVGDFFHEAPKPAPVPVGYCYGA